MYVNLATTERVTLRQIRQAHPDVSFPADPKEWSLNALGYAVLERTDRPAGDVVTEGTPESYTLTVTKPEAYFETEMVPQEPIEGPDGEVIEQPDVATPVEHVREVEVEVTRYRQTWEVRAFTAEEQAGRLAEAQSRALDRLNEDYEEQARPLTRTYPDAERLSWGQQNEEAVAYQAWLDDGSPGEAPATPALDAILEGRNGADGSETLSDLVEAVLIRAETFVAWQSMTGKRQRGERLILAAKAPEEAEAVTWATLAA